MKKLTALLVSVLLFLASSSFAAVGVKVDGVLKNTATDINFKGAGNTITSDGSTATFNVILAGAGTSGGISMTTDQVSVRPGYSIIRKAIASSTSSPSYATGTMDDGTPGQIVTVIITSVDSSGTFTLTPATKYGYTSVTFDAAKDQATFLYVSDTVGWIVLSHTACTINVTGSGDI